MPRSRLSRSLRSGSKHKKSHKKSHKSKSNSVHKKKGIRKLPPSLKLWNKIVRDNGYMIKGSFKKIPKEGSKALDSLRKDFNSEKKRLGL